MRSAQQILAEAEVIAVVGASRDPRKPSHSVPLQMLGRQEADLSADRLAILAALDFLTHGI